MRITRPARSQPTSRARPARADAGPSPAPDLAGDDQATAAGTTKLAARDGQASEPGAAKTAARDGQATSLDTAEPGAGNGRAAGPATARPVPRDGQATGAAASRPAARRRLPRRLVALLAASLLLAAAGTALTVAAAQLRAGPAAANRALTDQAATRRVSSAIGTDVTRIFSYSYTDLPATQQAARQVLAGPAAAQYGRLSRLLGSTVSQRLTVTTRVVRIGVVSLTPATARLLVFLSQTAARAGSPGPGVPAQLAITAQLRAGHWRITGIEAR